MEFILRNHMNLCMKDFILEELSEHLYPIQYSPSESFREFYDSPYSN